MGTSCPGAPSPPLPRAFEPSEAPRSQAAESWRSRRLDSSSPPGDGHHGAEESVMRPLSSKTSACGARRTYRAGDRV
eukprot:scaffold280233_cov35-Tisochrysis_lutea.AAC.2